MNDTPPLPRPAEAAGIGERAVAGGEPARGQWQLERAGNAGDGDALPVQSVAGEGVERRFEQPGHDVVVEPRRDDPDPRAGSVELGGEDVVTRHGRGRLCPNAGVSPPLSPVRGRTLRAAYPPAEEHRLRTASRPGERGRPTHVLDDFEGEDGDAPPPPAPGRTCRPACTPAGERRRRHRTLAPRSGEPCRSTHVLGDFEGEDGDAPPPPAPDRTCRSACTPAGERRRRLRTVASWPGEPCPHSRFALR